MRVAHIIMVHKNPTQLLRLVNRLKHPGFDIYIHLDEKVDAVEFKLLEHLPQTYFIKKRVNCNWAGWSFTRAIVQSLKEVIATKQHYDFINLISGQDYPIHSADETYNFFIDKIGQNFMHIEKKESVWYQEGRDRFEKFHFTDSGLKGKYLLQNVVNSIAQKRKLPDDMEFYGGSNSSWWTITHDSAAYVVSKLYRNSKFHDFFKYTWGSDEFVIATVIMNSEHSKHTNHDNLRYIDWSEGKPNPKYLGIADLSKIVDSKMIFARKFDIDLDSAILDELDKY
ncbi:beta-1,6-N-acetylglucosaminyltransferase [Pedobacter jejuensis]|uniref:Peptide O-xylosyltransferase n=1 Tax=Pedobacter jejuensis TaxID=1268550 RepID=A0A3N0BU08_9SPHI|nr:beta-1,6-N-acetylglucosaminyltransferase [Pedobacter jejuensis]RNL52576.1 glycosyltransferase [Pedobacter jejuensis]